MNTCKQKSNFKKYHREVHKKMTERQEVEDLTRAWENDPRWKGITRPYKPEDVERLRGSVQIEYTLARMGADRLWHLLETEPFIRALGALTGNQAVQQVKAGLKAIYLSGWQVAGDANTALHTYPDQSLYPVDSVPTLIRRLNNALIRADQIAHMEGRNDIHWFAPIVADAEAGFGGPLNTFELIKAMIESGAAAVHLEDQLSSLKKCGHMGGKVLVPASEFIHKLVTARLASDVLGIPTLVVARTDALSAQLIRSDSDSLDSGYLTGKRSYEGYYYVNGNLDYAIARGLAYAPYADIIWCETARPDIEEARDFAKAIHEKYPGKWLAYNCSPSFNWRKNLSDEEIKTFQETLGEMGYKFQFVTLAGFHSLNASMFELARAYKTDGMYAYSQLQDKEFEMEKQHGYSAIKHQRFVGAGYFDDLLMTIMEGQSATTALKDSTEEQQFEESKLDGGVAAN
jgi:isocitrate lyase